MARTPRLAAAAVLVLAAVPAGASAAPIAVTSAGDGVDPVGCSLREAVESANTDSAVGGCTAGSGADTITLEAGTYKLAFHGAENDTTGAGGTGDLDVGGDPDGVTIVGAGAVKTFVDGDAADRVFDFHAGASEVRDLTVTNGKTPDAFPADSATTVNGSSVGLNGESAEGPAADDGDGGGVRNAGSLTLTRVVVSDSHAGAGGAGFAGGAGATNFGGGGGASVGGGGGSGGNGGGIANEGDGELTVNDSTVTGNTAGNGAEGGAAGQGGGGATGGNTQGGGGGGGGNGGGIYQEGDPGAALTISRSQVNANGAGGGGNGGDGGTGGDGTTTPGASTSGSGGDGGEGGGVYVAGGASMDLSDTTIDGNSAGNGGNGGQGGAADTGGLSSGGRGGNGGGGGGLKTFAATNTIAGSAVVRNSSGYGGDGRDAGTGATRVGGNGGDAGNGGGVDIAGPTQLFSDSTIASNGANGGGNAGAAGAGPGGTPGTEGDGGTGGGTEIEAIGSSVTLDHLTIAANFQGAGASAGRAGGLDHEVDANPPVLQNTIVANNSGAQCGGTTADGGHNISFPDPECASTIHADPLLGELGPHGGLSPTMQLLPGSPARDAAGTGPPCTASDQRGVTRPKGLACDIGAVEMSPPSATTGGANSIQPKQASVAGTVNPGQLPTTYFFRFGTTTAYDSKSPTAYAGTGGANVVALATLRGLTPNAIYHYRLFVSNPDGSASGIDRTFRTMALRFPGVRIETGETTVRKGIAKIKVACPDRTAVQLHCNGTLALAKHRKKATIGFGKRKFSIKPGITGVVKVPVSAAGRELLARGEQTVTATARAGDGRKGKPKFTTRRVKLKTP